MLPRQHPSVVHGGQQGNAPAPQQMRYVMSAALGSEVTPSCVEKWVYKPGRATKLGHSSFDFQSLDKNRF